ncbi:MAG: hypothetical protein [Bacteriophage sp.]|jgi:hypothetical protein|uniref:Uncharacterized protein n=1 Tax=Myoviridae sp. ctNQV2 TaxID=2827683 RepID=A0A8S5RZW7_9CAUD|nr:MAG: hypothetical protein [Bacteriophage sp.]DAF43938.1 MAG TPA: hypothetical protein [Myoviridae sp. ctNQV2]
MGEFKNIGIMSAMAACDTVYSSFLIRKLEDNTSLVVTMKDDVPNEDEMIKSLQLLAEEKLNGSKVEVIKINKEDVYTPPPLSLKDATIRFLEVEMKDKSSITSTILSKNDNKPFYTNIKNSKHQKSRKKRR